MELQQQIYQLIEKQLSVWDLAKTNYTALTRICTRKIRINGLDVIVQYNPARAVSTGAKLDTKSISERKCFLCKKNMPKEELGIEYDDYEIHMNPYPIFHTHLVIAHNRHIVQDIVPHFGEILLFAEKLPDLAVFFNGIDCGASAPDHLHFQATKKEDLPIIQHLALLLSSAELISEQHKTKILFLKNYFCTAFYIESNDKDALQHEFQRLIKELFAETSPKLNIVCISDNGIFKTIIFPRLLSRPWQYAAPEPQTLMVSPGCAEMCGIIIIPKKEHFLRINKKDIIDIYQQVSLPCKSPIFYK